MVARPSRQNGKPVIYASEATKLQVGNFIQLADKEASKTAGTNVKTGYEGGLKYLIAHYFAYPVVKRPWGSFQIVYQSPSKDTTMKIIRIEPMGKLSLQKHQDRSETWRLLEGRAIATIDGVKTILDENIMSAGVNPGQVHRLESDAGAVILELAEGPFRESDIIRLEDAYGRTEQS